MPRKRQNEDAILRRIAYSFRPSRNQPARQFIALGIGDDAALFCPKPGHETILTCDWFLEGTHFLREKHPPDSVGWKCLARAVSDIAAMGGAPRCFLLSLALPETHTGRWLDLFLGGLRRASRKFQCALAGGDTTRRNEILINVTVVGEVRSASALLRSGARPDDILYVSGRLGEAELGLQIVRQSQGSASKKNPLTRKHLYPEPRLALAQWLVKKGLATIPQIQTPEVAVRHGRDPLQLALHGGDDYELLFAVPLSKAKLIPETFRGVRLTAIGKITRKRQLMLLEENGRARKLMPCGWDPFRKTQ